MILAINKFTTIRSDSALVFIRQRLRSDFRLSQRVIIRFNSGLLVSTNLLFNYSTDKFRLQFATSDVSSYLNRELTGESARQLTQLHDLTITIRQRYNNDNTTTLRRLYGPPSTMRVSVSALIFGGIPLISIFLNYSRNLFNTIIFRRVTWPIAIANDVAISALARRSSLPGK